MTFGTMIDIAIGLALVYLMLSLLAASITELIANILDLRGKNLMKGINAMLTGSFALPAQGAGTVPDPGQAATDSDDLLQKIVKHPLVQPVHAQIRSKVGSAYPSYLPATQFSSAVLDVLRAEGKVADIAAAGKAVLTSLPADNPARIAINGFIAEAGADVDKLKTLIERWFDQSMERVSGIYQRGTQIRLLIIGLLTAMLFNVSTFAVVEALATQETLRESVVKVAEATAKRGEPAVIKSTFDEAKATLENLGLPIGWGRDAKINWPTHIIGWLVTALAVSLGAPFWFNLMTQLLNLRKAGAKPPASGDIVPGGTPTPGKGATS